jgi:hypothetical protein
VEDFGLHNLGPVDGLRRVDRLARGGNLAMEEFDLSPAHVLGRLALQCERLYSSSERWLQVSSGTLLFQDGPTSALTTNHTEGKD